MNRNKILIIGLLVLGIISAIAILLGDIKNPYQVFHDKKMESRKGRIPKKDRIDLAWAQEREMTMDPETGEVPGERLLDAWKYMMSIQRFYGKAAIPGIQWQSRGPNNCGGRTRAICIDISDTSRKTIWTAGVNGGIWKTTDITAPEPNWVPVNDMFQNLAVTYIAQAPSNHNIMYFCTGEGNGNSDAARGLGVWKSTNKGVTWTQLTATNNSSYHYCQKLYTTGNGDTLFVATRTGLYRSVNGGTTFSVVLGTASTIVYDIERAANGTYYATSSTGGANTGSISKSFNGGTTWIATTIPAYISRREIEIAMADNDTNIIWGLVENASRISAIIKSTNAGNTWDTVTSHPIDADPGVPGAGNPWKDFSRNQAWYDLSIAVDPNNSNVCFVGGIDLFKTANGGTSWQQVSHWYGGFGFQNVHADQHYAEFSPGSSNILYFLNDGGIYRTQNANATIPSITSKERNYITTQFYACDIHPTAGNQFFLAGSQDNGSHRFTTSGINSTTEVTGGDGAYCHIDQNQPLFQFTSYVYNNYYRSTNGGNSFSGASYGDNGRFINPTDYDDSLNFLYAALSTNNYLRWNNPQSGASFTPVRVPQITAQVSAVTVSPNVSRRVYFGSSNGRIVRVDSANIDTMRNGTLLNNGVAGFTNYVNCIEVEKGNENHIIAIQSNYGVNNIWETKNGGTSWTACDGNLPDMPVRWILLNPDKPWQAIIATELGVWSTDSLRGATTDWQPSNAGLANTRCTMLKLRASDKMVIVSTHGRGLYSSDVFMEPYADFMANRTVIYQGQGVQFTSMSGKATSYSWNFGDATSATTANPFKVYTTPGIYTVSLAINGGFSTKTQTAYIQVLPYRGIPYTLAMGGNFDVNATDFASSLISGTAFARGSSSTTGKAGTRSGSFAWVTGLSGNYANNTTAYLYTPNYNFSAAGTYTFSFYCRNVFEIGYDGFRVEYSTDTGTSWIPLATTTSTGWYDFANTAGTAAFPVNQAFFNANNATYALKSFNVSFLQNNTRVAFRFVFKTDPAVTAAGVAIDDIEIQGPSNNALPLQLISFSGKRVNKETIELDWQTTDEINVSHFEIERKFNWENNFEWIGKRTATNSKARKSVYDFEDLHDLENSYYRLKMIDMDGSYTYSNIVFIGAHSGPTKNNYLLIPISGQNKVFKLYTNNTAGNRVQQIEIINNNGQVVATYSVNGNETISLQQYSSGVYYARFKLDDGTTQTQKVLVQ
jgi:PKD repeat protein